MRKIFFIALFSLYSVLSFTILAQNCKSVSILGDSYSTFEGFLQPDTNHVWYFSTPKHRTDVVAATQTWWHHFIKKNNFRLCNNNSFSGSTICNTGYNKVDYSDRSFIARMNNLGCPDIILIFGATNDSWANSPVGEYKYGGWTKNDLYSFRPAMAYMLDFMTVRYPNVEIYFVLNSSLKKEINKSVETICRHYNIDCIKLENIDTMEGHPSVKGMLQISEQITSFLDQKNGDKPSL